MQNTTVNARVSAEAKAAAVAALEGSGVSLSDVLRAAVEYVAKNRRSPFQTVTLSEEEDADLIAMVEESRRTPREQYVSVDLDSLR
ncbi:type II toxin-antitoxin system RelB/DinJ family antitoxin [Enterobacteriaceae bacterium H11S18]|uniref:type II toxin-antitoxin system RelB/DinJ family antitoxin n=1 Tax=Dryocola clanedunensis TaxID=2925396 RepID=UPI0022F0CD21|nr:type II toxin-antitoxin system RelB/DinJ family antitoxin [Dryocola clanedunensis]MCT4707596.1 type II toxin-antitoxin system RelB/DinJ family antitoxin [Dryocola clanedunensis]MCT4709243.1 type II toxin-antitoxin system RelB/DinJ family antitoxin [Dryocola clanedunensis]